MSFTVEQVTRMYRIYALVDYERPGDWLLLSAGTGLMMSVMDQEPRFRWAIDIDPIGDAMRERLTEWIVCMESLIGRVCACGWFSRPENGLPMARILASLKRKPLVYFGANERPEMWDHCELTTSLDEFLARLRGIDAISAPAPARRGERDRRSHVRARV